MPALALHRSDKERKLNRKSLLMWFVAPSNDGREGILVQFKWKTNKKESQRKRTAVNSGDYARARITSDYIFGSIRFVLGERRGQQFYHLFFFFYLFRLSFFNEWCTHYVICKSWLLVVHTVCVWKVSVEVREKKKRKLRELLRIFSSSPLDFAFAIIRCSIHSFYSNEKMRRDHREIL